MSSSTSNPTGGSADTAETGEDRHEAGAFDIRNFIALLIGVYGLVLVVYGLVDHGADQTAKSDGININLWAGIGMVVVAAGFAIWARVRPVVVPDQAAQGSPSEDSHA